MKIKNLQIRNFRGFEAVDFEFNDGLNVLAGVNGSGKSTVLDALAISLSWLIKRIQRDSGKGFQIPDLSIRNDENTSKILALCKNNSYLFRWEVAKSRRGVKDQISSYLNEVSELAKVFQDNFERHEALPMIAYYPVSRAVSGPSTFNFDGDNQDIFDVYDNALGSKTSFKEFFEWFRTQEDIVNEQAQAKKAHKLIGLEQAYKDIQNNLDILTEAFPSIKTSSNTKVEGNYKFLVSLLNDPAPPLGYIVIRELLYFLVDKDLPPLDQKLNEDHFSTLGKLLTEIFAFAIPMEANDYFEAHKEAHKLILRRILTFFSDFPLLPDEHSSPLMALFQICLSCFKIAINSTLYWLTAKGLRTIHNEIDELTESKMELNSNTDIDRVLELIHRTVENDRSRIRSAKSSKDRDLQIVQKAIEQFVPEYTNLRVEREGGQKMLVEKNGKTYRIDQLSEGEKNLIAMVGDIARRFSITNSNADNPLEGIGIVLIDEIDLHLHPKWQRRVITQLRNVFPNCQFFISTHSPQVLSHVKPEEIFLLGEDDGKIVVSKPNSSYGMSSDRILEDLLDVNARPEKASKLLAELFNVIQHGSLEESQQKLNEVEIALPDDVELSKARVLIKRKELVGR